MADDPVKGKRIRWTYDDGPVAGKTFEHRFEGDGTVTWRDAAKASSEATEPGVRYEAFRVTADTYVVAYLATSGWTLTTIVDETSGKIVSVASNDKSLVVQHGRIV